MGCLMKVSWNLWIAVSVCFMAVTLTGTAQPASYTIVDLGTLGGTASYAYDVNIHGDVVGTSTTSTGETRAFLYQNGSMTNLGVLDGTNNYSQAFGINDAGVVVGVSTQNGSAVGSRPFAYSAGTMTFVGSLGGNYGWANEINNSGQIVGISAKSNGITHAFVKAFGSMIDLGSLSTTNDYSIAYGINDLGSVAGYSTIGPNFSDAFLYHNGSMQDIGNLGGFSRGFSVNNSDHVTGSSIVDGNGNEHAFLWHDGTLSDLGTTGGAVTSHGLGINNLDQVVGTLVFDLNHGELNHGFLYSNGNMIDVNTLLPQNSGWVLRDAQAINDVGQIVGFGIINGQERAYLLSPVPEPSTLLLLGIGAISLLGYRRNS